VIVLGREVRGRADGETVIEGEAELRQGDLVLQADRLSYDPATDRARAVGQVRIRRDGDRFTARELDVQLRTYEGSIVEPTYFFSRIGAGGQARRLDLLGEQRARARDATYSSCPADAPGGPAWQLETSDIRLDFAANEGLAEDARLRFLGVPILALPRLSFPVTSERKSGWLPPSVHVDDRSGIGVAVPYYWNIAPHRDATLTPVVQSRRGVGFDSEWRYLEPAFGGTWRTSLLPADRVDEGRARWSLQATHDSAPQLPWQLNLLARRASDDKYWKDFPRAIDNLMPRLLPVDLRVARAQFGASGEWRAYARVQRWQVLQDSDPSTRITAPYERVPQIGALWMQRLGGGFELAAQGEVNRFGLPTGEDDGLRNTGVRLHGLASLSRPLRSAAWTLAPRVGLNVATYRTDRPLIDGTQRASRIIPTVSVDSSWVLERDSLWFGRALRQTLEPRLFYVNTPFRDQGKVPNFDAAGKDFNFESLYTDNAFSGVDRVSDAHQLTAGATTRLIDPATGAEALRLGVAQRYLLRDQLVTPDGVPFTRRFSDVLLLGSTTMLPRWTLDAAVQYSPEIDRVTRSVLGVRHAPGPFRTWSATYRFARQATEQLELAWQWPLAGPGPVLDAGGQRVSPIEQARRLGPSSCNGSWYGVGRLNYSLRESRLTDSVVGFEYDAGCWIGRVVAERLSTGRSEATNRLHLQLELVGLSRLGTNPLKVLKDNIPGYRLLRDDDDAQP
jgi:LPS-assembly protein